MGRVGQVGLLQAPEEPRGRKLPQLEGGFCDQLLQTPEDVVRQGAEGCVGDVPAEIKHRPPHIQVQGDQEPSHISIFCPSNPALTRD